MTLTSRIDSATRLIKASPETLYGAFITPDAIAAWRPPAGMTAQIEAFEPREGGRYRMAFVYDAAEAAGKTIANKDVFEGRFVELVPSRRIVEEVEFVSNDPAFAGTMTITTTFAPVGGATLVTFTCSNVPSGVSPADHEVGIASSLANLAAFVESQA